MEPSNINKEKWANEIGRVFLAFGSIEHATVQMIDIFLYTQITKTATKLPLTTRIDLLLEIASAYKHEAFRELEVLLEIIKKLVAKRNLIAHNPYMLEVYENENDEMFFKEKINSLRDSKKGINQSDLEDMAEKTEKIAGKLFESQIKTMNVFQSRA